MSMPTFDLPRKPLARFTIEILLALAALLGTVSLAGGTPVDVDQVDRRAASVRVTSGQTVSIMNPETFEVILSP